MLGVVGIALLLALLAVGLVVGLAMLLGGMLWRLLAPRIERARAAAEVESRPAAEGAA